MLLDGIHEEELMDHFSEEEEEIEVVNDAVMEDIPREVENVHIPIVNEVVSVDDQMVEADRDNAGLDESMVQNVQLGFVVLVRKIWSSFFTAMLMNPSSFGWAKQLLSSLAWDFFQAPDAVKFSIPAKCPDSPGLCLKNMPKIDLSKENSEHIMPNSHQLAYKSPEKASPSMKDAGIDHQFLPPLTPPEKIGDQALSNPRPWHLSVIQNSKSLLEDGPVIVNSLRRSDRQKKLSKGFKISACSSKGCLGCQMDPPTIPTSIIRNLGTSFCKIGPVLLSDEALDQKPLKKKNSAPSPSVKKQPKKKPSKK